MQILAVVGAASRPAHGRFKLLVEKKCEVIAVPAVFL